MGDHSSIEGTDNSSFSTACSYRSLTISIMMRAQLEPQEARLTPFDTEDRRATSVGEPARSAYKLSTELPNSLWITALGCGPNIDDEIGCVIHVSSLTLWT
ncbi:hypothetical protein GCM10022207_34170 [Streptomyces lannensis]|uniref:Uncharacterized protein n=1 Tax=Streptomyces lannensis TaxID=766498 RepID=A0ABP7K5W5_9ACTN